MTATDSKELDRLAMSVGDQPGSDSLWPNPEWSQEAAMIAFMISQLRQQNTDAVNKLQAVSEYVDRLASDRNFKPVSIVEDLRLILDGYKPDSYVEKDGGDHGETESPHQ